MRRSRGVVASAVIAIIGSVITLLFGAMMVLSLPAMRSNPNLLSQPNGTAPPFAVTTVVLIEAVVFLGLSVVGIVCTIGLLRLKNWARISFLVFAGFLCFGSISIMFGGLLALFAIPRTVTPERPVPPGVLGVAFAFLLVFGLMLAALAVWWLIYFNRPKTKEQFVGEGQVSPPRHGPLSITVIAWLMVVGASLTLLFLPFPLPMMLFGIVFRGWASRLILALFSLVHFLAGLGMLRWSPRAHSLAVAVYVFGVLNLISYFVVPGAFMRLQEASQEFMPQNTSAQVLPDMFFRFIPLIGLVAMCVPLWLLITRRRAFLDAARLQEEL